LIRHARHRIAERLDDFKNIISAQPQGINVADRVASHICIRIQAPSQPNGIRLKISPGSRVVVAIVVVRGSGLLVEVLPGEPEVEGEVLGGCLALWCLIGCGGTEGLVGEDAPVPATIAGRVGDHARRVEVVRMDVVDSRRVGGRHDLRGRSACDDCYRLITQPDDLALDLLGRWIEFGNQLAVQVIVEERVGRADIGHRGDGRTTRGGVARTALADALAQIVVQVAVLAARPLRFGQSAVRQVGALVVDEVDQTDGGSRILGDVARGVCGNSLAAPTCRLARAQPVAGAGEDVAGVGAGSRLERAVAVGVVAVGVLADAIDVHAGEAIQPVIAEVGSGPGGKEAVDAQQAAGIVIGDGVQASEWVVAGVGPLAQGEDPDAATGVIGALVVLGGGGRSGAEEEAFHTMAALFGGQWGVLCVAQHGLGGGRAWVRGGNARDAAQGVVLVVDQATRRVGQAQQATSVGARSWAPAVGQRVSGCAVARSQDLASRGDAALLVIGEADIGLWRTRRLSR
jgi:hypothetical protein